MNENKFQKSDKEYLQKRKQLAQDIGMDQLWEISDQFGLYSGIHTIGNKLAVYEILKQCLDIPGNLVEFGSWKGSNLLFIAKVISLLQPNNYKEVYSFDSFEGLQTFHENDQVDKKAFEGKYQGDEEILRKMISLYDMDSWVKIIKGDAMKTIDIFEKDNPHMIFSFAYIDFDIYLPVKRALDFLGQRMSRGGIIAFDQANTNVWKGEGTALREFLDVNKDYSMKTIGFARQPTLYIVKD